MNILLLFIALLYGTTKKGQKSFIAQTSSPFSKVTTDIEVISTTDRLVLRRRIAGNSSSSQTQYQSLELQVERRKANLTLNVNELDDSTKTSVSATKSQKYQGIFGIYNLPSGYFLALIKSSTIASAFPPASGVREIKELSLLKIPQVDGGKAAPPLTTPQLERQREALELLLAALSRHTFYFTHIVAPDPFDVTRSTQSRDDLMASLTLDSRSKLQWRGSDERFFWNFNLLAPLIDGGLDEWVVPVTNAWASSSPITIGGKTFTLSLISRRSRHRAGQRYIKRGIDSSGDVANFVETEQALLWPDGSVASFLQLRGSIPIFWSQPDTWKLRPAITPKGTLATHAKAVKTHLVDLLCSYVLNSTIIPTDAAQDATPVKPSVFMVNLIDKSGSQGTLGRLLHAALKASQLGSSSAAAVVSDSGGAPSAGGQASTDAWLRDPTIVSTEDFGISLSKNDLEGDVGKGSFAGTKLSEMYSRYGGGRATTLTGRRDCGKGAAKGMIQSRLIWFDYHYKCKKGNVASIAEIFPHVRDALLGEEGCYFRPCASNQKAAERHQRCIIRTNCVDCLDRTNVVQTAIARWALLQQLAEAGVVSRARLAVDSMSLPDPQAEAAFRGLWGENGDMMSMLYAGTRALKRDVTRLGKRTQQGAIDDGINSAMRYYINNYQDARNQMGLDIALGHVDGEGTSLPKRIFHKITQSVAHIKNWAVRHGHGVPAADEEDEDEAGDESTEERDDDVDDIAQGIDRALSVAIWGLTEPMLESAAAAVGALSSNSTDTGRNSSDNTGKMDQEGTNSVVDEHMQAVLQELKSALKASKKASSSAATTAAAAAHGPKASSRPRIKGLQKKVPIKRRNDGNDDDDDDSSGASEGVSSEVASIEVPEQRGYVPSRSSLTTALETIKRNLDVLAVFVLMPLLFFVWGKIMKGWVKGV